MVITQSPSLHFPNWIIEDPERVADLQPVSHLIQNNYYATLPGKTKTTPKSGKSLIPFRNYLFKSSVEARKNLLILAKRMRNQSSIRKGLNSA